jgi:hypothetical protein
LALLTDANHLNCLGLLRGRKLINARHRCERLHDPRQTEFCSLFGFTTFSLRRYDSGHMQIFRIDPFHDTE